MFLEWMGEDFCFFLKKNRLTGWIRFFKVWEDFYLEEFFISRKIDS